MGGLLWGPFSVMYNWYLGLFSLGVRRPVLEADHSPPSAVQKFKMVEVYVHSHISIQGVVFN
jgi:hypothetical protein